MTTQTKTIRVLLFPVGQPPVKKQIGSSLEAMQAEVGGYIQMVPFINGRPHLDVCCNEEGKNEGLPLNRMFGMVDALAGNFFVTATNPRDGESMDLTDADIASAIAWFAGKEL